MHSKASGESGHFGSLGVTIFCPTLECLVLGSSKLVSLVGFVQKTRPPFEGEGIYLG